MSPIFLLSYLNPICWEGSKSSPFAFIGRMGVVDGRLNLNCKFNSSPQKIVIFNILIAFIFTTLLLKIAQRLKDGGTGFRSFFFFFKLRVFYHVISYRQSWNSFLKFSPLQNGVPASLFFFFCRPEHRAALETWSRGRSNTERWCNQLSCLSTLFETPPLSKCLLDSCAHSQEKTFSL